MCWGRKGPWALQVHPHLGQARRSLRGRGAAQPHPHLFQVDVLIPVAHPDPVTVGVLRHPLPGGGCSRPRRLDNTAPCDWPRLGPRQPMRDSTGAARAPPRELRLPTCPTCVSVRRAGGTREPGALLVPDASQMLPREAGGTASPQTLNGDCRAGRAPSSLRPQRSGYRKPRLVCSRFVARGSTRSTPTVQ